MKTKTASEAAADALIELARSSDTRVALEAAKALMDRTLGPPEEDDASPDDYDSWGEDA